MDSSSLKGKVIELYDLKQVTEKFRKREFVVEVNSSNEKGNYIDYIKLQAVMATCDTLNYVSIGDLVVVRYSLMGRKWKNKEGQTAYFTNVEALEINVVSKSLTTAEDNEIEENFPLGPDDDLIAPPSPESDNIEDDVPF